jgi:polysaccharide biosynthesis transport protein
MIESPAPLHRVPVHDGFREFVRLLSRRKLIILATTVLIGAVAWTIASTTTPRFAADALLALDVRKVQIVEHEVVSRLPQESPALRTELDVITSRSLAEQVVDRLGLTADPDVSREATADHSAWKDLAAAALQAVSQWFPHSVGIGRASTTDYVPGLTRSQLTDWLIGNLKVSNDGRSLTILVSFTSENAKRAAQIANAIAENYLDDQVRTKVRATAKASDWLGEKLIKMRHGLEVSEAAVDDFRRQAGLVEARGATIPAQRLSDVNAQLANASAERARAEAKLQAAREGDVQTLSEVLGSPTIQQLRKELANINSQIAENRDHSTFYKLKVLDAQAAAARMQINQEMSRILASLAGDVQAARKREAESVQSLRQMEEQLGDAYHSNVRLSQLQREADANRSIYETFLARYKQTMEQEGLAAPDARLLSRAEPPSAPNYPKKLQFVLIGTFGGLGLGVALGFIRERLDRRVRQTSEVEALTGIPVFGLMPRVPWWRHLPPQDYPVTEPSSHFSAALTRIRTALQAPGSSVRNQVIVVTSAKPGEGKTSFCTGLARSLSKNHARVLVIDADPYQSRVASAFGAPVFPNFSPVAEQRARLSDIVQADTKSTAHFILAPNADDLQLLLHSGGFTTLIEEARRAYDVIILDTPPVMTSSEAAVIGRLADRCLFLVRWGRTSWDEMTSAIGFLRLCGISLDGIVMIGVDAQYAQYGGVGRYDTVPADDPRRMRPNSDRRLTESERAA